MAWASFILNLARRNSRQTTDDNDPTDLNFTDLSPENPTNEPEFQSRQSHYASTKNLATVDIPSSSIYANNTAAASSSFMSSQHYSPMDLAAVTDWDDLIAAQRQPASANLPETNPSRTMNEMENERIVRIDRLEYDNLVNTVKSLEQELNSVMEAYQKLQDENSTFNLELASLRRKLKDADQIRESS